MKCAEQTDFLAGYTFCQVMHTNIAVYITSYVTLATLTAATRVLYIKANNWVRLVLRFLLEFKM
jgi:hypothetical protein